MGYKTDVLQRPQHIAAFQHVTSLITRASNTTRTRAFGDISSPVGMFVTQQQPEDSLTCHEVRTL